MSFDEDAKRQFDKIQDERYRQDLKWGLQTHDPLKWLAILGEEVGEANRAILESDMSSYEEEMIHVAAVAVAALECLDRKRNCKGVYLAGPIKNCTESECNDWRQFCEDNLNCDTINPYKLRNFSDKVCDNPMKEIVQPDLDDIDSCAVLLANCWKESPGTSMEIYHASNNGKLVVTVHDGSYKISGWVQAYSHKILETVEDAVDYINCLLED